MKEYILSMVITFTAGFAIAILPNLDTLTMEGLRDGTLVGLVFTGIRTGFKFVLEAFVSWYSKR